MTTPTPVETPLRLLVAGVAIMLASCTDADLPSEPAVPDPGGNFHAAQALLETSSIRGFAGLGPSIHSTFADLDSGAAHVPMPLQLIGKTLEYSPTLHRYEISERLGGPLGGVRFVLYRVHATTGNVLLPLVETGYVDITQSLMNRAAGASVKVWSNESESIALEYVVTSADEINTPNIILTGVARDGADAMIFNLETRQQPATASQSMRWQTTMTNGFSSRADYVIVAADDIQVSIDGSFTSHSDRVDMEGSINSNGGILVVKMNEQSFARLTMPNAILWGDPTSLANGNGDPLSARDELEARRIHGWFSGGAPFAMRLLHPIMPIVDIIGNQVVRVDLQHSRAGD